eukprot:gnl/TRDRNA2_/TRDRNA2_172746_c0_seq9.p1 gnl/TRDRNA2_/TRDRNA2_172746_c0~~gnl/TRDRNA2_/TRDRNA2_172746_c0_seq9.p1  ORF type:complete len:220 (+),score=35.24 gnl/TRDRNA2_/TRDRNA2_172746_c0_seq9:91-660(+)
MAGLLRRATARAAISALPRRGGEIQGPITPIPPQFPCTSEKTMGRHGFGRGSYSITKGIVGPMYRPPWVVGGIHNPTLDPNKHFNMQDRFKTLSFADFAWCFFCALLPARVQIIMVCLPVSCVLITSWLEQRREPMEIFMDREEYFKDFDSYNYGVYFDHHHFSHMLCHRRAHKWGYAGMDVALESSHH